VAGRLRREHDAMHVCATLCTVWRAVHSPARYASQLNQEMESGPRRIPVWKVYSLSLGDSPIAAPP
jgi:hypothetical protein